MCKEGGNHIPGAPKAGAALPKVEPNGLACPNMFGISCYGHRKNSYTNNDKIDSIQRAGHINNHQWSARKK